LLHVAKKLPSKTRYWRKEGRKDRSDERTRKKTLSNYWLNKRILRIERGSVRSRMENLLWKSL
jgi:hypothetical protein